MEKFECEKAKDYLDETTKNPVQYHRGLYDYGSHHLRDIMEAEMYFEERRFNCTCRKRKIQLPEEVPEGEPDSKRSDVSNVEAEDGSGSERDPMESDVEEETQEEGVKLLNVSECGPTLDSLLPNQKGSLPCRICELARASLSEGHVTDKAIQLFEEVKQNCSRCCGSSGEDAVCHCAENFEWVLNFASKEERQEMGWDLGWELDE